MKTYNFNLTKKCNVNCIFCEIPYEEKIKSNIPNIDEVKNELILKRKEFDSITFTGGEPTIVPEIIEIIHYAKNVCKYDFVNIESNGIMYYYIDFVDKLINAGVDSFQISFHTTNSLDYDKITQIKHSYDYVIKGIENLTLKKQKISINIVIHKLNYKILSEIVKKLINLKVVSINFSSFNSYSSDLITSKKKEILIVKYSDMQQYIVNALQFARNSNFNDITLLNFPICIKLKFNELNNFDNKSTLPQFFSDLMMNKPKKCNNCKFFNSCCGIWNAYINTFGIDELEPNVD